MASAQFTLVANTMSVLVLDAPAGRIVVTQAAGTPAEVYATTDGISPIVPTPGSEVSNVTTQRTLAALLGAQVVLQPHLYGDHMVVPTVLLLSAGTPTVLVEW